MAGLPITERSKGIALDNEQSNPDVNRVPIERITAPTLIFQATEDPRELRGGHEMARWIPNSQFIGLTGGHFLSRHEAAIWTVIATLAVKRRLTLVSTLPRSVYSRT